MESTRKNYELTRKKRVSTDPDVVRRREQRAKRINDAFQLRMAGASYNDIVKAKIGYNNPQHVGNDIRRHLQHFVYETPEDLVSLDLARVDDIHRRVYAAFVAGKTEQAGMLLRIIQFRREILGVTAEQAIAARENSNQLVNNGIMVVQGSAEDYLRSMMQAAGASPEQQRTELDRIAASNREVVDAEVVEDSSEPVLQHRGKKLRRLSKKSNKSKKSFQEVDEFEDVPGSIELENYIKEVEENNNEVEKLPSVQLSEPLLNIDFPDGTTPKKKRLRIPVKINETNVNASPGVPYRAAPKRSTRELSTGARVGKSSEGIPSGLNRNDANAETPSGYEGVGNFDEIEVETFSEDID